jgi:alpha-2-macroglobulin
LVYQGITDMALPTCPRLLRSYDIHEGIEPIAGADSYFPEAGEIRPAQPRPAQVLPLKLDRGGAARATITDLPNITTAHEIVVELEYQDANGEILTAANRIDLWPAKINLGIRTEGWTATEEHVKFQVIALDLLGKPMADQSIAVDLFRRTTYSYRKRLIGGFYGYESMTETRRIGEACQGTTDARGLLLCDVKSTVSGEVLLRAQARDDLGNRAVASRTVWVAGKEDWWFEASGNDRMDVLPEQKGYEPGETARSQVRMPFREATALITVEREGIIDSYVSALSGKVPVIEVPIKDHYAPNVFVSVLAVRGRVGEVQPTALVDLGKPAFRLGVAPINVGWKPYELQVRVSTDKEVYKDGIRPGPRSPCAPSSVACSQSRRRSRSRLWMRGCWS